jgi:hypothetical protein
MSADDKRYELFVAEARRIAKAYGCTEAVLAEVLKVLSSNPPGVDVRELLAWEGAEALVERFATEVASS